MNIRQSVTADGFLQFQFGDTDSTLFDRVKKYLIEEVGLRIVECIEDGITNDEMWMDVESGDVHLTLHWHYSAGLFLMAGDKPSEVFLLSIAESLKDMS